MIRAKLITCHEPKPVPHQHLDWSAFQADRLEPVGHGYTEAEAISDLIDQIEYAAPVRPRLPFPTRAELILFSLAIAFGIAVLNFTPPPGIVQ